MIGTGFGAVASGFMTLDLSAWKIATSVTSRLAASGLSVWAGEPPSLQASSARHNEAQTAEELRMALSAAIRVRQTSTFCLARVQHCDSVGLS